jgi:uncharacterized protein YigE (DUF2233 family)
MKTQWLLALWCLLFVLISFEEPATKIIDERFPIKIIATEKENLAFFWKDTDGKQLRNFTNLIDHLQKK